MINFLSRLWFNIEAIIRKIISAIMLGIVFFLIITPISLILKLFGRDELKINKSSKQSYWIDRTSSCCPSKSFENQY